MHFSLDYWISIDLRQKYLNFNGLAGRKLSITTVRCDLVRHLGLKNWNAVNFRGIWFSLISKIWWSFAFIWMVTLGIRILFTNLYNDHNMANYFNLRLFEKICLASSWNLNPVDRDEIWMVTVRISSKLEIKLEKPCAAYIIIQSIINSRIGKHSMCNNTYSNHMTEWSRFRIRP